MKTIKRSLAAIAISAAALAGCQEIQIENDYTLKKYHASMEEFQPDTKTYLGEGNQILWGEGDVIEVYGGNEYGKYYAVSESSVGKSSAEFVEIPDWEGPAVKCDKLVAVYADIAWTDEDEIPKTDNGDLIIPIYLNPERNLVDDCSLHKLPMVAVSSIGSQELSFKNIGGILKLSIKGKREINSIKIVGNSEEHIAGCAYVTVNEDEIHQVSPSEDFGYYKQYIELSSRGLPPIMLSEKEATDFYIPIIPTDFTNGFTVTITDTEGNEYIKSTNKRNEVKRSHILTMPEFLIESTDNDDNDGEGDDGGEEEENTPGGVHWTPTPGQWIDLGLSVKWAAWNLGAESPEEYGDKYAWGETEPKTVGGIENYEHKEKVYSEEDPEGWHWEYKFIGENICGTQYDAAHVKWGEGARMPNFSEIAELASECEFNYGTYNETEGFFVKGPSGKIIFLPAYRMNFDSASGESGEELGVSFMGGTLYWDYEEERWRGIHLLMCNYFYQPGFMENHFGIGISWNFGAIQHIRAVKE